MKTKVTGNEEETRDFAKNYAESLQGAEVIGLTGDLGAGKTTFSQGLALGLHHRQVDTHVGLGARMRLDIGVLSTEKLLGPFAGKVFGDVYILAAAVVATTGVALSILVGHHRAHRSHDRRRHEILRSDPCPEQPRQARTPSRNG